MEFIVFCQRQNARPRKARPWTYPPGVVHDWRRVCEANWGGEKRLTEDPWNRVEGRSEGKAAFRRKDDEAESDAGREGGLAYRPSIDGRDDKASRSLPNWPRVRGGAKSRPGGRINSDHHIARGDRYKIVPGCKPGAAERQKAKCFN